MLVWLVQSRGSGAGVVSGVIWVRARGRKRGAKIDRLRSKDEDWDGALGGCDLNDERDHDSDET
jgi:hypothetical protein